MNFQNTLAFAQQLDEQDSLKQFRSKFHIPQHEGKDTYYFTGNSLGLQPKSASVYLQEEMDSWANLAVEGHFYGKNPWTKYHDFFPPLLAPIMGAKEEEIVVMNQLTVNLHLLMVSFYNPTKQRYKIICEAKAFPSDQYAFESQVKFHGFSYEEAVIEVAPRAGEHLLRTEDIVATIEQHKDSLALVLFGGINYYTGQVFDMKTITDAAHRAGAYAGFDLAHAAGNVELKLHEWNVDFACWCSYKYMNSGPGGIAGAFIHEKHIANEQLHRFAGWWGYTKETRFKMAKGFEPIPTAEGWQLSNTPILLMATYRASLEIFAEAGMDKLHAKRNLLSDYLLFVLDDINAQSAEQTIEILTPRTAADKGCQVSMLMKKDGRKIFDALMQQGVIVDWREPNVIRVAPVPLYNTFEDIWKFGSIVQSILSV